MLESIVVPPGLTLTVRGTTIKARAASYEDGVRDALNFEPAPSKYGKGDAWPDGIYQGLALEIKYADDFARSLRNPSRTVPFPHRVAEEDIAQARKYAKSYSAGVLWVTNDAELSEHYERVFTAIGIANFRYVTIPSRRE